MKRKFSIIFAILLIAFVFPHHELDAKQEKPHEIPLRVMTYNIAAGIGVDGNFNIDRIAETIRTSGADVIGLQEVDVHWGARSQFENEIRYLAEKLDMHAFFAPIYDFDPLEEGEPRRQFGLAVLSKYPIIHSENHEISRLSTQDDNPEPTMTPGFPEVVINIKGIKVSLYVTHLDYRADPFVREMQVEDMLNIMSGEHQILVGDLNAEPENLELQPLMSKFQDAWDVTNSEDGNTFPVPDAIKRIDYILTSPNLNVTNAQRIESDASDHFPVIADIMLKRK